MRAKELGFDNIEVIDEDAAAAAGTSHCICWPEKDKDCGICVDEFMKGRLETTWNINWNSGCDNGCQPSDSKVSICYDPNTLSGTCNLMIKVYDIPKCFNISTKDICILGWVFCNGRDLELKGYFIDDNGNKQDANIQIKADPKVFLQINGVKCNGEVY